MLWDVSTLDRVRACGRRRIAADVHVKLKVGEGPDGERRAHFAGLQTCGSPWTCPVCSAKIRQRRAEEIEQGVRRHLDEGGGVELLLLTLPHNNGDRLGRLLDTCALAFRRVLGGRGWVADRALFGVTGTIRVPDFTGGGDHGWHPHLHVLLLTECPLSDEERIDLQGRLFERWARCVVARGHQRPLRGLCGMEPVRTGEAVAAYLEKAVLVRGEDGRARRAGLEMMRSDLKTGRGGRTPWEILADFARTGDAADLALWHEYEQATRGRQSVSWSRGLKGALLIEERTDEELAEEEVGGVDLVTFEPREWAILVRTPGALVRVLELAEEAGVLAVVVYVQELTAEVEEVAGGT